MSTEQQESMGSRPIAQHEWLNQLVGEWRVETEMVPGPGEPPQTGSGTESVKSLGGLWAYSEGKGTMPDGSEFSYYSALGYDLTFNEYRGCWFASMSSHLWKYVGELSADGRTMTLNCEGPDMVNDGKTAMYRDVIEIIDANHRTLTAYGQGENGEWTLFMKSVLTRI